MYAIFSDRISVIWKGIIHCSDIKKHLDFLKFLQILSIRMYTEKEIVAKKYKIIIQ